MSNPILPITNVMSVTLVSAQTGLGLADINTAILLSSETPVSFGTDDYRIYTNVADVITDWGAESDAVEIATAFFAQNPNVLATNGYLAIAPLESAEKVETAVARLADLVYFTGVLVDKQLSGADLGTAATYIQGVDKIFFYASDDAADYATGGMLDLLRQGAKSHTRGLFYSVDSKPWLFAAAYAGRALSTDFTADNTATTMHLKSLAGMVQDPTITQTELTKCVAAGVDCYVAYADPCLHTSGANEFFDNVYNGLWLKNALQVAGFNYLRVTNTKIPQTEIGMEGMKSELRKVCEQAKRNGYAAPGAWSSSTVFGNTADLIRSVQDVGYYIYSKPISQQLTADRTARKAPAVQIALKLAGAIHSGSVIVNVNF